MKILVFLEHHDNALANGSLGVLTKAVGLGEGQVAAILIGSGPLTPLTTEAGRFGATTVHVCDDPAVDGSMPQPCIDVLEQVISNGGYDTVFFSTSVLAADVAAGLSGRLDAGLNWDLFDVVVSDGDLVGKRLALQDSVAVDVGWRSSLRLAMFRTGSFDPQPLHAQVPVIETVECTKQDHSRIARLVSHTPKVSDASGPSIEAAEVVVAGGIGLGGEAQFALAEELAELLGGAVGATRAAVTKGWYPASTQIGQTGKTVRPKLYIGLGISGAVQHKVGMQSSKVIVAINSDANAPIFDFSDLSVVGDVHVIVPKLIELLRTRKGL